MFLLSFMFSLLQNRRIRGENRVYLEVGLGRCGGVGHGGEVGGGTNNAHTYNAKIIPAETLLGIGGVGMKERRGGGEFKYDTFDIL
jgi:hypothetical protein